MKKKIRHFCISEWYTCYIWS